MDYFFRYQDNPYANGGAESEDVATESPVDMNGHSQRNSRFDDAADDDYRNDEEVDDDTRASSFSESTTQDLARGFDSADNGDDAAYGDDANYPNEEGNVASTAGYFQPRLPSLENMLPLEEGPAPKDEVSFYDDQAPDIPEFGVYAIGAVVVFFVLRRCCCARNNGKKKIKSSAKITYNTSPRYRPVISVV